MLPIQPNEAARAATYLLIGLTKLVLNAAVVVWLVRLVRGG